MTVLRYDVLGIGNAIVDVIARTEDDFLVDHGMRKGTMALIDEARAGAIYDAMGPAVEISGGSAANTIVGVASLGARAAFVGKVKDDALGGVFAHDIRAAGVAFATPAAAAGPSTGRCYVLVTPDGERTMNTYPGRRAGASSGRHRRRRDRRAPASPIWKATCGTPRTPRRPFSRPPRSPTRPSAGSRSRCPTRSASIAIAASFWTSSAPARSICVFANERELQSLYETADFDAALAALRHDARLAVVTRSEKGCLVVTREETEAVPAIPVERVVDATGAGDLFAAGFLVGLARAADYRDRGAARRARRRRGDRASRGPARDLPQGAGRGERPRALIAAPVHAPSTAIHSRAFRPPFRHGIGTSVMHSLAQL